MMHIFETTVRGLIAHYPTYNQNDTLCEMDNGDIVISAENPEYFMRLMSNEDTFILSFYLVDAIVPYMTIYFCDGALSLTCASSSELLPYSIGGYWTVRDIFTNLNTIFKVNHCSCPVFDALFLLAQAVDTAVVNELKCIVNQLAEYKIENPQGIVGSVELAASETPNQANHRLTIVGGDKFGVYNLKFEIGVYFIDSVMTINYSADYDMRFEYTGVLYTDIRNALVVLIKNAKIKAIESERDNNFLKASLLDITEFLVPDTEVVVTSEPGYLDKHSSDDIITDFANRVISLERFDISMYLKHQGAHEAVLFSKVNHSGETLEHPLFRLTIQDGIVIAKYNFHDPKCQVTVYMLPCYENRILDKVTVILEDGIMYKRGVITIHSIHNNLTGIMNAANIALSHAISAQYGKFDSILANLDPVLSNLVEDIHLGSKVIYPVT